MRRGRWLLGMAFFGPLAGCAEDGGRGSCPDESGYPSAPAGVESVLYVCSGAPDDEADGSIDHPYPRLQAAIDRAAPGSALRVHPGTYAENLEITKPLSIVGAEEGSGADAAGIIVQAPEALAVNVLGAEGVLLRGLKILAPREAGLVVRAQSAVTVEACSVEGALLGERELGYGIIAQDASSIIVQRSVVAGSASVGILLFESRGIIVQNAIRANEGGGIRVDRADGETEIRENEIAGNAGFSVAVFGAKAIIVQNQITDTRLGTGLLAEIGDGIVAAGIPDEEQPPRETEATVDGNEISRSPRIGVLFSGGARGIIVQNQIRESAGAVSFGAGIWLQQGAGGTEGLRIEGNVLTASRFVGIGVKGNSRGIIVQNTVIDTAVGKTFVEEVDLDIGDGIGLFQGALGQLQGNTLERNGRLGVVLDAADAGSSLRENVVKDSGMFGIIVQNQPQAPDLSTNTVSGSGTEDIRVGQAGATLVPIRSDNFSTQDQ
jgi:Right handed beta helix region